MPNMSYCRFQNTLEDLQDCKDALDENGVENITEEASGHEASCMMELIELCKEIAYEYGE